jgi:glutamyl-tRNA reductase
MIDCYKIISISHQTVDIAEIEKYVIRWSGDETEISKIRKIKDIFDIDEIAYLNTCNRVTYIMYTRKDVEINFLQDFFSLANPIHGPQVNTSIDEKVSVYEGLEAVRYLFEVASSIDSLVVGESEIFRQVREAFDVAKKHKLSGDNLRLLEKSAIEMAKKIYTTTRIGESPLSIAALAAETISSHHNDKKGKVILVGAGETNQLMAKFLVKQGFQHFEVYNRTLANADKLAKEINGLSYDLSQLYKATISKDVSVVVVCTSSQDILVDRSLIDQNTKNLTVVDLSVPRNVDPNIAAIKGVRYVYIDELKMLAERNLQRRRQEVSLAKSIIAAGLSTYQKTYNQRQLERSLETFPSDLKALKNTIVTEVYAKKIASLHQEEQDLLSDILDHFIKKATAIPMKRAKGLM